MLRLAAAALALVGAAGTAQAAEPQRLSFSVGAERYEVPPEHLASVGPAPKAGLEICPDDTAQKGMEAFTAAHIGDTVTVSIGDTVVTYLQVKTPYAGGCITWPIHPVVAANYQSMLTGKPVVAPPPSSRSPAPPQKGPRG